MSQNNTIFSPAFPQKPGLRHSWGQLQGCSAALALSQVLSRHQGLLMVLTKDTLSAQRLADELRFFSADKVELLSFPDWETLPYDAFSPHQDIVSERLASLYQLPDSQQAVLLLPVTTLMQRLPPQTYVQANSLLLERGQRLDREKLRLRLERSGYRAVNQVMEHGEFSIRGSIMDLFPMGSVNAYRIDLLDDDIDSLRVLNPETQRSRGEVEQVRLLPAREYPLDKNAVNFFREQWCSRFDNDPRRCSVYQDATHQIAPPGAEYFLPLFFEQVQTLFDYLPANTLIASVGDLMPTCTEYWEEINSRYEELRHDIERPLLPPADIFLTVDQVFGGIKQHALLQLSHSEIEQKAGVFNFATHVPPVIPVNARAEEPLARLTEFLAKTPGRVLITAETTGRRETLLEVLGKHGVKPKLFDDWAAFLRSKVVLGMTIAPLEQGLVLEDADAHQSIHLICEAQLFGDRVAQRRRRSAASKDPDAVIRNLTELDLGAPVVHEDHGVGRYHGLVTLDMGDIPMEFLYLEYARGDKLYVPVTSLHLISRFTGVDPEHAPLHRLGSPQWDKAKRKAAERVRDVAAELLDVYARRAARKGHVFQHDPEAYQVFSGAFPFEETPDQQAAIDAVMADMHSPRPMDRLICGDVGFGKTEVAMRAAFVAVQDGKQVAVLVPTTLLAQQHYQNFLDRFADWPVKVEQLSRFRSGKQVNTALAGLESGDVDIVIGTHKLIQGDIKFKRLGLVIIDEEHRFGVRQKERFKSLRSEVDILTLTATPIPRSLNMALADLRDLSIIATAPLKRLAVKTFIQEWRAPVISEAIHRELRRGGQIYFLHNAVDSIEKTARELAELVPEARVDIAHGQMPERDLERVMQDFYHRRFNVLVCTTIIETGIDIPTANTIIINRADRFGLAQLYQLRGRVGRSHHRAYAYLITPSKKSMTKDAAKRLDALSSLEELGVGFTLATHDLEIRGAGEMLGDEQSGHLQEIGYNLYTELLERAVESLKQGKEPSLDKPLDHGVEIDLKVPALLPEDYLPDVHNRLILYKRIANVSDEGELRELQAELIDRFGLLPQVTKNLFKLSGVKLQASPLGVRKIELGDSGGRIQFVPEPPVDPMKVIQLIQQQPHVFSLDSDNNLRINQDLAEFEQRLQMLNDFFGFLQG